MRWTVVFLLLTFTPRLFAGQYNDVLSVGDAAPVWNELIGVDGQVHSRSDLDDANVIVVAFICNSCPYAVDVEDRLIWLHENYSPRGASVAAINVNTIDEDAMDAMKAKAAERSFAFDYLYDPTQRIAKAFGAITTPQFFVLGPDRKVVYMGSMDDSPDGKSITRRYVAEAVDAALQGVAPEISETVPIGCQVRYARERRTRKKRD